MSGIWRCGHVVNNSGVWRTSRWYGWGVPASEIPSTGTSGPAYLFNDIAQQGALPTDEFSSVFLAIPSAGTFKHDEYSAFSFTDAPDGVYTAIYEGFKNGISYGSKTITMMIGAQADHHESGALLSVGADFVVGGSFTQRQHLAGGALLAVPVGVITGGVFEQRQHVTGGALLVLGADLIADGLAGQGENYSSGALLTVSADFIVGGAVAQSEHYVSGSLLTAAADFIAGGEAHSNPSIAGGALLHVACDFIVDGQYNQQFNYTGGAILECNARFIAGGEFHQVIKKLRHSGHLVWNEQARKDQIEYVRQHPDNFTALLYLPVELTDSGPANDGWLDEPVFGRADANQQKTGYADPKVCWVFERPREDAPFVVDGDGGDLINEHEGYLTICAEMDLPVGAALEFEDELSEGNTRRSWWYVHHITSLGTTKAGAVYYLIPLRDFTGLNV